MSTLAARVDRAIQTQHLLRRGQSVLLAVSGGVDSMVLLRLLHTLSRKQGWRLTVAHLNHQLRGRSSNADERLVIRAAKQLGLPIAVERAQIKAVARAQKLSLEMAARQERHAFLARTAARLKIRTIALAHHADDHVELFFLRLLRGSGSDGLGGMKLRNPSPANAAIELIRPLLAESKTVLRDYARAERIRFREDASNRSPDFQRNRVRHELLPLLRRNYQPALERTIVRVMDLAAAEGECLGELAAAWLRAKRRPPFARLPVALQRRCLQLQLQQRQVPVDYELVEHLRLRPGNPIKVSSNLAVIAKVGGRLEFRESGTVFESKPAQRSVNLTGNRGEILFGNVKIFWQRMAGRTRVRPKPRAGREVFDADKVGRRIVLRHWRPGDRFQPIGMRSAVKLQDLFTNQKIPRLQRHQLIVATKESGEMVWVEKLRISEVFKWSESTIRRLQWRWKRL